MTVINTAYELMRLLDEANIPGDGVLEQIQNLLADNARLNAEREAAMKRPDVDRLYAMLDEDRSEVLSLIADACLDAGLDGEAAGWRWLAMRKKWPAQDPKKGWAWFCEGKIGEYMLSPASCTLPPKLFPIVREAIPARNDRRFAPTCRAALEAVVAAFVGGWREPRKEKP